MLRPELLDIARALLERGGQAISLDDVAEALGALRVTPEEIDALFSWLEARGREVGTPVGRGAASLLGEVLAVARVLRQELGRAPDPREIAERAALPLDGVRRALWFAQILQR
ncbi:MAG: sigma-70 domain-containing protein [Deltaproteobacteria bacterium]